LADLPKIVLGLGNPGTRYLPTRHNLGFRVLDCLAERWASRFERSAEMGNEVWTAEVERRRGAVVLAKPCTFMNRSGEAAVALCEHYDTQAADLLVVYDDADLELGRIRLRPGGGAGGHNGLRSLIDALGTDSIPRLRLGVRGAGRERQELADYVLEAFEPAEQSVAEDLVQLGAEAVEALLGHGLETAMNSYNARFVISEDQAERSEEEG
jgi:PTH1 family peptidyl-tRNA hydrolase